MKEKYENAEEDKHAIELINKNHIDRLSELEELFKKESLPFRERYAFYFIGKQHELNENEKKQWGTDKCRYKHHRAYTQWWEEYLTYYCPMLLKMREERNPKLPRIEYPERYNLEKFKEYHPYVIQEGWKYSDEMKIHLEDWAQKIDFDNPGYNTEIKGKSIFQVHEELKKIDEEYDTYTITIDKNRRTYSEPRYCPACQQAPCMCSDPF